MSSKILVLGRYECESRSLLAGSTRSSDAMGVSVDIPCDIIVNNSSYVRNVETASWKSKKHTLVWQIQLRPAQQTQKTKLEGEVGVGMGGVCRSIRLEKD